VIVRHGSALVCALAALAILPGGAIGTPSKRSCAKYAFERNGVPWRAQSIRTVNVTCKNARALIRSYAIPRNCQFHGPCQVGRYVCNTTSAEGSEFTESCKRGKRAVRWAGSYSSS
jgi:hypothetical protein